MALPHGGGKKRRRRLGKLEHGGGGGGGGHNPSWQHGQGQETHGGGGSGGGGGGGGGGGSAINPSVQHGQGATTHGGGSGQSSGAGASAWVIERQRELQAQGYSVVVDGVWGPRTQRLWLALQRERRRERKRDQLEQRTNQLAHKVKMMNTQAQQQQKDYRHLLKLQNRDALKLQMRSRVDALETAATRVHPFERDLTPYSSESGREARLVSVREGFRQDAIQRMSQLVSDHTGRGLYYLGTRLAQGKGVAQGLSLDALMRTIFDPELGSFDARNESHVRVIQKFLKGNGHPDLTVNGVYGPETFQALADSFRKAEAQERREQVSTLKESFYDNGILRPGEPMPILGTTPTPGEMLDLLQRKKGNFTGAMVLKWLQSQATLHGPFYADRRYTTWRKDFLDRQLRSMYGPFPWLRVTGGPTNLERQMLLPAGYGPFFTARSFQELEDELRRQKWEEKQLIKARQEEAEKGRGFWGTVGHGILDGLDYGADYVKESIVEEFYSIKNFLEEGTYEERVQQPAQRWVQQLEEEHPWYNLAFEIAVDPLNLVGLNAIRRAVLLPYQTTRFTTRGLEVAGVTLAQNGKIKLLPDALQIPERGIRQIEAALPPAVRAANNYLSEVALGNPTLLRAVIAYKHSTRLASEGVSAARARVLVARRHAFQAITTRAGGHELVQEAMKGIRTETRELFEQVERDIAIDAHVPVQRNLESLAKLRVSLFVNDGRDDFSTVGWQLYARLSSELEQIAVGRVARKEARDIVENHRGTDEFLFLERKNPNEAARRLTEMYEQAVKDAKEQYGTYFVGGADPKLAAAIRPRVKAMQAELNDLFRHWQNFIEENAVEDLWDENGLWLGVGGQAEGAFKHLARHAMDLLHRVIIKNPNHGKFFDRETRDALIQDELLRKTGSVRAHASIEGLSGRAKPEGWVEETVDAYHRELLSHWKETADGWTDTRELLYVPASYLRQFAVAVDDDVAERSAKELAEYFRFAKRDYSKIEVRGFQEFGEALALGADVKKPLGAAEHRWGEETLDDTLDFAPGEGVIDPRTLRTEDVYLPGQFARSAPRVNKDVPWSPRTGRTFTPADKRAFAMERELARIGDWISGGMEDLEREMAEQIALTGDVALMRGKDGDLVAHTVYRSQEGTDAFVPEFGPQRPMNPEEASNLAPIQFRAKLRNLHAASEQAANEAMSGALRSEGLIFEAFKQTERNWAKHAYKVTVGPTALWRFSVLAMRPAWVVGNTLDNFVKAFLTGVRDPRYFFLGAKSPGKGLRTIFDIGVAPLRYTVAFIDRMAGTNVLAGLDGILATFWTMASDQIQKVFWAHNVYVPEKAINAMRMSVDADDVWFTKATNALWEVTGNRPEAYFRRVVYRNAFVKAQRDGMDELDAFRHAVEQVEKTLFDYSKISAAEQNFKLFMPFVQFWRKNTTFWIKGSVENPWFLADLTKFEDALGEHNEHLPEWMRRYADFSWMGDVAAKVPGLRWMAPHLENVMSDPLNLFSFAPLYRMFKAENPLLPPDAAGLPFISGFVDGMADFGLGLNPLLRKPLEAVGVLNYRAWQAVFPQTQLIEVFTRKWWSDRFPNGLNIEAMLLDPLLAQIGLPESSDLNEARFNEFVQREMAGQAARGETVSRAAATKKIQDWLAVQSVVSYFARVYLRSTSPADTHLYRIAEALHNEEIDFNNLSPQDQRAYQLFKRRGWDPLAFDQYRQVAPLVQTYYRLDSYEAKEEFKQEHPEILAHVEPAARGEVPSLRFIQTQRLVGETDAAMDFFALVDQLDISRETMKAAEHELVTPELRQFWNRNDTPAERRGKHLRGIYYRYLAGLTRTFYALPEKDYEAKDGFLKQHPELQRFWQMNNAASDDYLAILNGVNADLRERYFEFVDSDDWDAADAFLKRFPFIFEFTSAAGRVDENGNWIADSGGKGLSQHALDYQAAKRWLDYYFGLSESAKSAWLNSDAPGADIVRAYFDKYASGRGGSGGPGGMTAHAADYLAAKRWLDHYFSLSQAERNAWLHAGSPGAKIVLAYFKKYGKQNRIEQKFNALVEDDPFFQAASLETQRRLLFWKRYYALNPGQRPKFVLDHAEDYGVFIYGALGQKERHDREQEWFRKAYAAGLTERSAHYLRVKPLLDFFQTLKTPFQKQVFLRANPELQSYLDDYSRGSASGDPKLDKLLDRYFNLPADSPQRSQFLQAHPEVQDWFDKNSSPRDRALHRLLEVYFKKTTPQEREKFLTLHPEIQDYFDKRQRERRFEQAQLEAFDNADPRLAPFFENAAVDVGGAADRYRDHLAAQRGNRLGGGGAITVRRT